MSCPICHEVFREPLILSCSHSFCRHCLSSWWDEKKPLKECPVCRRRSSREDPPLNLALKNLCEGFRAEGFPRVEGVAGAQGVQGESLCDEHSLGLGLFCLDDQKPVCVVCRDSGKHRQHSFSRVDEVTPELRHGLHQSLQTLKEHLQVLNKSEEELDEAAAHVEVQTRLTQRHFQQLFNKLHQFLKEEEEARIKALREEEEQKREAMKAKMAAVRKQIETVSSTISATERTLEAADGGFLLGYKAALERVQRCPLLEPPQLLHGALLDQAEHLENTSFNIWSNMKELVQFYPFVLDPTTAGPELVLSEDLSSVILGDQQNLPENPERLKYHRRVLGSECWVSGTHTWVVEVSGDDVWSVGVMSESVNRKGSVQSGLWSLQFSDGRYRLYSPPDCVRALSVKKQLLRVTLKLDLDKKTLSLSDADTNSLLHTFKHIFPDRMFPYFQNYNNVPLKIVPLNISVKLG